MSIGSSIARLARSRRSCNAISWPSSGSYGTISASAYSAQPSTLTELNAYSVRSPGQAGSYFHGYSQIMQLRTETEIALGDRFDRKAFNDFLLDQGLLPPKLLAKAVREQFVPQQKAKKG